MEFYSDIVKEMISNLDFPVVAVYEVVDDQEILNKDSEASRILIENFKNLIGEQEGQESSEGSELIRSNYPPPIEKEEVKVKDLGKIMVFK